MKKVLFMLLLMIIAQPVMADTVPYTLNCAGTYDENSSFWEHDFDLGVMFTEITQVSIQWSGGLRAAAIAPPFQYVDVGVRASIADVSPFSSASVWAGVAAYPVPEEFDCTSFISADTGTTDWSSLLDGKGKIYIVYTEQIFLFQTYDFHGYLNLDNATLVVEGTVVPEPISMTLMLLGTAAILRKK